MGDILPPKRQAVVDRLRRRFNEQYRSHQNGCFPRYEQAANDLFQQQRHETQLLKQRYLEAKAKKVKKSDHKNVKDPCLNNSSSDSQRSLLVQKLNKRQHSASGCVEEPALQDPGADDGPDRCKLPRKEGRDHLAGGGGGPQQQLPSFSVQIVQQFTSSSSAQSQQTIQTNVTVKALSGVKTGHDQSQGSGGQGGQGPGQGCNDDLRLPGGTSISVGTNIECKRERQDDSFAQCGGFGHRDPPPGNFADTFAHLGSCFPEDSNDDVIGSDILNDINTNDFFDDIFANPSDLMKEFNFDDSVDPVKDSADDKDTGHQEGVTKNSAFQFQGFEQSGLGGYGSRMSSGYPPLSPTLAGLDFKLREPSPAAQTLKQMAEQHQSMQQKQHQIGLSPSSRSPFAPSTGDGGFGDPLTLSSLRTNFLNGANMNSLTKGQQPPQLYGSFAGQQTTGAGSPGSAPFNPGLRVFKEESVFGGLGDTMDKRVHQDAYGTAASPVDQKPTMSQGPAAAASQQQQQQRQQPSPSSGQYAGTRPLSHFSDPHSGASPVSRQSPLGGAGSPFIRGLTPPPPQGNPGGGHFSANVPTRSPPNRTGLQVTQSQQMHLGAPNQQLQVSQSQQIQVSSQQQQSQEPKASPTTPGSQVHGGRDGVYGSYGNFQLSMSQSQSVSFASYGGSPSGGGGGSNTPPQAQQRGAPHAYMARPPPPEYKPVVKQGAPRYAPRGPYPTEMTRDPMQQPAFNPQVMGPQHGVPGPPQHNNKGPKAVYPSALTRNRAPNVNVGPEGLNISQRPPFEWRQLMMQQQQQQQHQQTQQRAPRFPQCYRVPAPTGFGPPMVRAPQQEQPQAQQRVVRAMQPQHPRHSLQQQQQHHQQQQQMLLHSVMGSMDTVQQQQMSLQQQMTSSSGLQFPDLPQHVQQQPGAPADPGSFSLDFLDSIESGASDLLNFDSVSGAHFSLLDDMGMLGK